MADKQANVPLAPATFTLSDRRLQQKTLDSPVLFIRLNIPPPHSVGSRARLLNQQNPYAPKITPDDAVIAVTAENSNWCASPGKCHRQQAPGLKQPDTPFTGSAAEP